MRPERSPWLRRYPARKWLNRCARAEHRTPLARTGLGLRAAPASCLVVDESPAQRGGAGLLRMPCGTHGLVARRAPGRPIAQHALSKAGGADGGRIVNLAEPNDLAVGDGEVFGDAELPESVGLHVVEQHRFVVVAHL
jgi:hypothetical protein